MCVCVCVCVLCACVFCVEGVNVYWCQRLNEFISLPIFVYAEFSFNYTFLGKWHNLTVYINVFHFDRMLLGCIG